MKPTVRLSKVLPPLIVVLLLTAVAPRLARFDYEYKKGSTWDYETLFAPFDFPVLKTTEQIQAEMDKAADVFVPYFNYLPDVTTSSMRKLSQVDLGPLDSLTAASMVAIMERGVVADDALPQDSDVIFVQKDKRAVKIPADNILGLSAARARLLADLQEQVDTIAVDSLLKAGAVYNLIVPNLVFNSQITDAVNADAASRISPTRGYISAGQLIVSKGEIVTADIAQILDSYKKEYETNIGSSRPIYLEILGNFLVAFILVLLLLTVIYYSNADIFSDSRYYYLLFIFTLAAIVILVISRVNPYWLFITPLTLVALYLQAFMRPRVIVPVYIISLLPLLVYAEKQFLLALLAFVSMALTYLALRLVGAMSGVVLQDLLRLLVASFLAVAGDPLIYLFEKLFNLVSNSRLSELADTSSKLLRELEQKAPGTFQHSLQVMNMADAVARSIDVNPLLLRVGALYHDIGKTKNPAFFTENQIGENPHDHLVRPEDSAKIVIDHVANGLKLA